VAKKMAGERRSIWWLLLLVPLFWGGAFGAAKHVVTEIPPLTAATLRFGVAGLLLIVLLTVQRGWDWQVIRQKWLGLLILAVTGVLGYNLFFFLGLQETSAMNGSLVVAMNPVATTIAAVWLLGEAWSRRLGFGMLLSLGGILTVISRGSLDALLSLSFNQGDLLLLGAVACWSTYSVAGRALLKDVQPLLVTTVTMVVGSCGLFVASLTEDGWAQVPAMSGQAWGETLYMAAFATVIAFQIWNMGVQQVGASRTAAYVNLVPINAMWTSMVFYGEQLHWAQGVGLLLVVSGVLLATRAPQKQQLANGHGTEPQAVAPSNT